MSQMMKFCFRLPRATLGPLLVAGAIGYADPSHAQKVDFSGQKITLAIATPSGGGYDLYGRLVARYLGNYLPGNPTLVPQNMPGAGSLIAANWLANVAPKDGTGIAIIPSATLFENLLGNASARFDARHLPPLLLQNLHDKGKGRGGDGGANQGGWPFD